jgi:hypothetical protein
MKAAQRGRFFIIKKKVFGLWSLIFWAIQLVRARAAAGKG